MRSRVRARRTNFGRRTSGMGNLPVTGDRGVELWTTIHMDGVGGVPRRDTGGTHVLPKLRHEKPRRSPVLQGLRNQPIGQKSWYDQKASARRVGDTHARSPGAHSCRTYGQGHRTGQAQV